MERIFPWRQVAAIVVAVLVARTAHAQRPAPGEWSQFATPNILVKSGQAVPPVPVPAVGLYEAGRDFRRTVAWVDGQAVQSPLFPSLVADPVDRALVLRDYQRNGYALTPLEKDTAFRRFQRRQFHDDAARRDARLREEHATLEDYRQYAADETRLNAMLFTVYRYAFTWQQRAAMENKYLVGLRRKFVIRRL